MKCLPILRPMLAGLFIAAGVSLLQADPVEFGFRFGDQPWHTSTTNHVHEGLVVKASGYYGPVEPRGFMSEWRLFYRLKVEGGEPIYNYVFYWDWRKSGNLIGIYDGHAVNDYDLAKYPDLLGQIHAITPNIRTIKAWLRFRRLSRTGWQTEGADMLINGSQLGTLARGGATNDFNVAGSPNWADFFDLSQSRGAAREQRARIHKDLFIESDEIWLEDVKITDIDWGETEIQRICKEYLQRETEALKTNSLAKATNAVPAVTNAQAQLQTNKLPPAASSKKNASASPFATSAKKSASPFNGTADSVSKRESPFAVARRVEEERLAELARKAAAREAAEARREAKEEKKAAASARADSPAVAALLKKGRFEISYVVVKQFVNEVEEQMGVHVRRNPNTGDIEFRLSGDSVEADGIPSDWFPLNSLESVYPTAGSSSCMLWYGLGFYFREDVLNGRSGKVHYGSGWGSSNSSQASQIAMLSHTLKHADYPYNHPEYKRFDNWLKETAACFNAAIKELHPDEK